MTVVKMTVVKMTVVKMTVVKMTVVNMTVVKMTVVNCHSLAFTVTSPSSCQVASSGMRRWRLDLGMGGREGGGVMGRPEPSDRKATITTSADNK